MKYLFSQTTDFLYLTILYNEIFLLPFILLENNFFTKKQGSYIIK